MDMSALKTALELVGGVLATLKQVKDLLPDGSKKEEVAEGLEQAERQLGIAEAQAAQVLGYELCKCTFPPQIMLFTGEEGCYRCPKCGYEIDTRPHLYDPRMLEGNDPFQL